MKSTSMETCLGGKCGGCAGSCGRPCGPRWRRRAFRLLVGYINLAQRGVDRHTDVLSFPLNHLTPGAFDPALCEIDPGTGRILLGDMVIDMDQCYRQAGEYGHSLDRELSYLAVHSVLHLLGYDHLDEGEEKALMRAHEEAIMARLGLER